ncbi:immunoglobulin J chain-like [Rhinatrema bivittatum]|uniref:immunoglobulin J chain-like n=1 Tax=Rhinatrema bivittatum TaxID=194408 RepID=UPI00112EBAB9|nr:immunoglobulin J chain-like [Rhinatrema bivittatum]
MEHGRVGALFWAAVLVFSGAALVTGQGSSYEHVLVNNKCKCVTVTSRLVPSKDKPGEEVVERNIRIMVPLKSRENISDPTSPLRTKFVYRLSELCKKCDPDEIELGGQIVMASQSNSCSDIDNTCYTYNRNKCYTSDIRYKYGGQTKVMKAALTPESCYDY